MAQDRFQSEALIIFPGKELDVTVQLLTVQLPNGAEQSLVEVGKGHLDQNCSLASKTPTAKKGGR